MKQTILLILAPLLLLAGCATPRQACLSTASRDVATIDRLILETRTNLDRGFAVDRELYTGTRVDLCMGGGGGRHRHNVGWSYCMVPETRVVATPVAIDTTVEKRKLAELLEARKRAEKTAVERIGYCDMRYLLK